MTKEVSSFQFFLSLSMLGNFSGIFAVLFFKVVFFLKNLGIPSECQTFCIQIRSDLVTCLLFLLKIVDFEKKSVCMIGIIFEF